MNAAIRIRDDQSGFTLVEMLAAVAISMVVLGGILTALDQFTGVSRATTDRNDAEDQARQTVRDLARNLRNIASPGQSGSGIERGTDTDLVFQAIDPANAGAGSNSYSTHRVRYCLDSSNSTYGTLWKQLQTWTSASAPALPSATSCPNAAFGSQTVVGTWISNASSGGSARPIFSYDSASLSDISSVGVDLHVDTDRSKGVGEAQMDTSVFLRNQNRAPTASFTVTTQGNKQVLLNGGDSADPDGQSLTYAWTVDGSPISATGPLVEYTASSTGSHQFALTVTDAGGLASTAATQTVNVQ